MKNKYLHYVQQHTVVKFLIAFIVSAILYAMSSFLFPILLAIGLAILLWRGSRQTGASEYIVEGKIPKLSIAGIQQMLDYVKKISTVIVELFKT
jgi:hypothetical protein